MIPKAVSKPRKKDIASLFHRWDFRSKLGALDSRAFIVPEVDCASLMVLKFWIEVSSLVVPKLSATPRVK